MRSRVCQCFDRQHRIRLLIWKSCMIYPFKCADLPNNISWSDFWDPSWPYCKEEMIATQQVNTVQ